MKEHYPHLALLGVGAVGLLVYLLTRNIAPAAPVVTGAQEEVAPVPQASIAPIQLGNVTIGDDSGSGGCGCSCDTLPGQPVLTQTVNPTVFSASHSNVSSFDPSVLTYNNPPSEYSSIPSTPQTNVEKRASGFIAARGAQAPAPNGRTIEAPPEFIGAI